MLPAWAAIFVLPRVEDDPNPKPLAPCRRCPGFGTKPCIYHIIRPYHAHTHTHREGTSYVDKTLSLFLLPSDRSGTGGQFVCGRCGKAFVINEIPFPRVYCSQSCTRNGLWSHEPARRHSLAPGADGLGVVERQSIGRIFSPYLAHTKKRPRTRTGRFDLQPVPVGERDAGKTKHIRTKKLLLTQVARVVHHHRSDGREGMSIVLHRVVDN